MFAAMLILVMGLSVVFNIHIVNFVLKNFNEILEDNSRCHDLQEAFNQEVKAFDVYVRQQDEENRQTYLDACRRTEACIAALPYDYSRIGAERYARTWNVKNSYETYCEQRDQIFEIDPAGQKFIKGLYQIYNCQEYLQEYCRRLVQATLAAGNSDYQKQVSTLNSMPYLILAFSVMTVVCVMLLTRLLSDTMIQPLIRLAYSSRKIAKNDFSEPDYEIKNKDEVGELVQAFHKMKHATEGYINTLKKNHEMAELLHKEELERMDMEKQLDIARLELLKNQINPHFLFNTLNTIACMANLEDAATTEKMITSMSNLFRYNLKTTEQIVPLSQELKVVEDYMYIQKMRFGERIRFGISLKVEPGKFFVPAFTLQPLAENAIIHGISKKEQGGRVFIRIWEKEEGLMISVADTGIGMEEKRREELELAMKGRRTAKVGIGLGNIYKRIHTMYRNGELKIYSRAGKGTVIQMMIPRDREQR
ncbi:MAG: sensor histidine kinase [Enterocloster sp.]